MREKLDKAYVEVENFSYKLGEVIWDAILEEDNTNVEIAKSVLSVFDNCNSIEEIKIADRMLIAICGYSIKTLIEEIEEREKNGYTGINVQ